MTQKTSVNRTKPMVKLTIFMAEASLWRRTAGALRAALPRRSFGACFALTAQAAQYQQPANQQSDCRTGGARVDLWSCNRRATGNRQHLAESRPQCRGTGEQSMCDSTEQKQRACDDL